MPGLRTRIEKSRRLAKAVGTAMGWYLRFCVATSKWDHAGVAELEAALAEGPVLAMTWHGRLLMIGPHWPRNMGNLSCIHDSAPIGRAAGQMQAHFGLAPYEVSARRSNLVTVREILTRSRDGISIGITADGPDGPGYAVKDAPLEWARTLQRPIFGYAFATRRHKRLKTWDRMMLPLPFSRGAAVFQRIDVTLPRKATPEELDLARAALRAGLDRVTQTADAMAGA